MVMNKVLLQSFGLLCVGRNVTFGMALWLCLEIVKTLAPRLETIFLRRGVFMFLPSNRPQMILKEGKQTMEKFWNINIFLILCCKSHLRHVQQCLSITVCGNKSTINYIISFRTSSFSLWILSWPFSKGGHSACGD